MKWVKKSSMTLVWRCISRLLNSQRYQKRELIQCWLVSYDLPVLKHQEQVYARKCEDQLRLPVSRNESHFLNRKSEKHHIKAIINIRDSS